MFGSKKSTNKLDEKWYLMPGDSVSIYRTIDGFKKNIWEHDVTKPQIATVKAQAFEDNTFEINVKSKLIK